MSLNPAQREAVAYSGGPLLVLAGAGSGKTKVITEKIAHLIRGGLAAERVYAITFTNKAAREMRERAGKLFGKAKIDGEPVIATFHALGLRFLQIEAQRAGLRRGFSVFDSDDSLHLLRELAPAGLKKDALEALRQLISRAKNEGLSPADAVAAARSPREVEAAGLYETYQRRMTAFNAVDFDDLIRLPVALLEADADLALAWRERIRYLLVDEYQDTNRAQYRLLRALAGERGALTVVGDDDQSIYGWRGAEPENLNNLARDYPTLKVVKLEQNYRCSARILRAANAVIANNGHLFEKRLWSDHADGPPLRLIECRDDGLEAERIAAEIVHTQTATKLPWSEFAVLYRGNFQSRALEKALRLVRVPYHVTGGMAFFERAEVKDLLAWLRLAANPDDDAAFLRAVVAPKREVGATSLERLGELAGKSHLSLASAANSSHVLKQLSPRAAAGLDEFVGSVERLRQCARADGLATLAERLVEISGYREHLAAQGGDKDLQARREENIGELTGWLKEAAARSRGRDGLGDLTAQLMLLTGNDKDEGGSAVRLMTLHSAKGLEFSHVYLVGLEDGTLPHEGAIDEGRLEEERRLFYVGITRAKQTLTMSWSSMRTRYGSVERNVVSRFIAELPEADLRRDGSDPVAEAGERRERATAQLAGLAALLGKG